ncbi:MAG: hypothetical protein ACE15C_08880 [Phycisphaerae bacterium]
MSVPASKASVRVTGPEGPTISPLLFGHNLEHTRRSIWQGLGAEVLRNRKLCGEPNQHGVPMGWYAIGFDRAIFRLDCTGGAYVSHVGVDIPGDGDWSAQRQRIEVLRAGRPDRPCGMGQDGLHLLGGVEYECRAALHSSVPLKAHLRVTDDRRRRQYLAAEVEVQPGDWREFNHHFTMPATDERCRFEITFDGPGLLCVGSTALTRADNFHGMRRDVIERLKEISAPLLRWPGGNFAGDYRWKDGTLPVDKRGGLKSFGEFTSRFTYGYDMHEIGTDEFIALCREIGAEPFITINISLEGPQEAAEWVEYCNGGPETRWGKVRAERGHAEPYRVKYWSLGNEMGYGHMKGANRCIDYCEMARDCARAMRKVDPTINLTASGTWFKRWIDDVPQWAYEDYDNVSFHWYEKIREKDFQGEAGKEALRRGARKSDEARDRVAEIGDYLRAHLPPGRKVGISYDEWNFWFNWYCVPMAVDGVFTAGFLNMLCREADKIGISMGAFFEPVNEGAILVHPDRAELTTMGQVFALLKAHQGGKLLNAAVEQAGDDIDAAASVSPDGKTVVVTLVNRSVDVPCNVKVDLRQALSRAGEATEQLRKEGQVTLSASSGISAAVGTAEVTVLTPSQKTEPSNSFKAQRRKIASKSGVISLRIPPFGVALVKA